MSHDRVPARGAALKVGDECEVQTGVGGEGREKPKQRTELLACVLALWWHSKKFWPSAPGLCFASQNLMCVKVL